MKTYTKKQRDLRKNLIGWLLVAPSLIFMLIFTVWPIFRSVYLSLTKYKLGMKAPEFIGLENYITLAGSSLFWKVMGNTLYFALITIIPSMVVGLFLAAIVNRKSRSHRVCAHSLLLSGHHAHDRHCQHLDVYLHGKERPV